MANFDFSGLVNASKFTIVKSNIMSEAQAQNINSIVVIASPFEGKKNAIIMTKSGAKYLCTLSRDTAAKVSHGDRLNPVGLKQVYLVKEGAPKGTAPIVRVEGEVLEG